MSYILCRYSRHDKRSKLPGWILSHLRDSHLNLSTDMALHIAREVGPFCSHMFVLACDIFYNLTNLSNYGGLVRVIFCSLFQLVVRKYDLSYFSLFDKLKLHYFKG